MKTVYKFKPHKHWNYIAEETYEVLAKFYDSDMIKIDYEKE